MKNLILTSLLLLLGTIAHADLVAPYQLTVVRNGVSYLQVAGNFWQGEYPGPVIDVNSSKKGKTTIQGWTSLRQLDTRKNCTIQNGIYHPWSSTPNSVINYYTLAPVYEYMVIQDLPQDVASTLDTDPGTKISVGDKIINVFYLSEGYSTATLVQGKKETTIGLSWDALEIHPEYFSLQKKTESLVKTTLDDGSVYESSEQWLYLNCKEGYKVFVQDTDLLAQKGVKEGDITDYGSVKGAN